VPDAQDLAREIFSRAADRIARERPPSAVYRLQLHAGFTLDDAARLVPYLAALGASDLYASPYLAAAPGSKHGYDVVDHNRINPELGGEEALDRLVAALAEHGMGHVLDFVPNHMGIGAGNPYWADVLENGPSSVHARRFDIDWRPVKDELENRVLLPILGDQYGAVLEAGELQLVLRQGAFTVRYYEHSLPINPRQYARILRHRLPELEKTLGKDDPHLQELLSIGTACDNLPHRTDVEPAKVEERHREKEIVKRRLAALMEASSAVRAFVETNVREFNGTPGEPRSFDLLDALLGAHAYRVAHWRVAGEEINYRRFFDINELAAIRMEDPGVFADAHRLVLRRFGEGKLRGLRIDHPDGLYDPKDYFRRLQEGAFLAVCRDVHDRLAGGGGQVLPPETWDAELEPLLRDRFVRATAWPSSPVARPCFVVVEKILGLGEIVPEDWAVHGTTGYEFLNEVNGLFVERSAERSLDEVYHRFADGVPDWSEQVYAAKKLILASSMSSEVEMLAHQLNRISETNRRTRDFTLGSLRQAIVEYIAAFPVYRSYVDGTAPADERDRRYIEQAVARARRRTPTTPASVYLFLRDILLGRADPNLDDAQRQLRLLFAMRLQQLTGPVTAKGVEDTAFYRYNRLIALNEVDGDPSHFGTSPAEFHQANAGRLARQPGTFLATATHDTKRGEDLRTRVDVLSELPAEWKKALSRLSKAARKHRSTVGEDRTAPDRNEEYLLYQTLAGFWPDRDVGAEERAALAARIEAFALKAAKEAKVHTSWTNPDPAWEEAIAGFVRGALADPAFRTELAALVRRIAPAGRVNSLAQAVLKVAAPGVPDVYQGTELWDRALVDPDNRRPVDFSAREAILGDLAARATDPTALAALARELWGAAEDGRVKLFVLWRALRLRQDDPGLFLTGDYVPLQASGPRAGHVVALSRRRGFRQAIAVTPRLVANLLDEPAPWDGTHLLLPAGSGRTAWRDVLTGAIHHPAAHRGEQALPLPALFGLLPVALLEPAS
jgi:(1->4)-alpha-D-glucan 1-alpha-D-glucosylmutase